MENPLNNENIAVRPGGNNFLPISILIAAVLISGSVIYAFNSRSSSGEKKYPKNAFTQCLDSNKYAAKVTTDYTAASAVGVQGTPTVFINGKKLGNWIAGGGFTSPVDTDAIKKQLDAALAVKNPVIPEGLKVTDKDSVLGDPNAPLTIVEYGDYQCPWCGKFFTEAEPYIRDNYVKTGKAKLVFRSFQFLGSESKAAAQAVECAKDQGKFWEYHDALYTAEHKDGSENNGNLNKDLFVKISQDLKLNAK